VLFGVIPDLQVAVLLYFFEILVRFKALGVVSRFQKCNLGGFFKNFDVIECQAKLALTN